MRNFFVSHSFFSYNVIPSVCESVNQYLGMVATVSCWFLESSDEGEFLCGQPMIL